MLLAGAGLVETDILLAEGRIAAIDAPAGPARAIDARGLLVLPGIVDIHGDAFERQLQPRPGVGFPTPLALADTEAQLLANGITTAFHGVTLSWEPGLRGARGVARLACRAGRAPHAAGLRHARASALGGVQPRCARRGASATSRPGGSRLLAFNDHTPASCASSMTRKASPYSERAGIEPDGVPRAGRAAWRRAQAEVAPALDRIAAAARAAGLPMASHDDDSVATRDAFRAQGARICEFPMAEEVGVAARAGGRFRGDGQRPTWCGAARISAGRRRRAWPRRASATCWRATITIRPCCRPPSSSPRAACSTCAAAWALISANPAAAASLADRGRIAPGPRADLVLVDATAAEPRAIATVAGGRIAWLSAEGWDRLEGSLRTGRAGASELAAE